MTIDHDTRHDTRHDTHRDLHSEQGRLAGEHPGRSADPVIKVRDLAWLELQKPDLSRAETFAHAFGFTTSLRTSTELHLRGSGRGAPCLVVTKGPRSKLLGVAFQAAAATDLVRLADAHAVNVRPLPESLGGLSTDVRDPGGLTVRVVHGMHELPSLDPQLPLVWNVGRDAERRNATQRPARVAAGVQRLGHVVLQSSTYRRSLDWYLDNLGLIVSDFLYYEGQRERGPTMSFMRCDRGSEHADHHTLAMTLGPVDRYVHSAYQVADLDALAAGGEHLRDQGYYRSWGIGRHIQGSQVFDYWRDPDGLLVEHFTDGDMFDCTLEPGWAPMTASGLAQWGPPATPDFLGARPGPQLLGELRDLLSGLRASNEFDLSRFSGLMKVARS